jgi:hypothetical protein
MLGDAADCSDLLEWASWFFLRENRGDPEAA